MDPIVYILIIISIILVIFSAFFSGSETAYTSLNVASLEHKAKEKKYAKLVKTQISNFDRLLMTLLIGNNIVNILSSLLIGIIFSQVLRFLNVPESNVEFYSTIITLSALTPVIVIFGEILPKIFAKKRALQYLKFAAYPVQVFIWLFSPFTSISFLFKNKNIITNKEIDLKNYVEIANQEGVIDHAETTLVKNAFDLDTEKVLSHFIKLEEVVTIAANASVKEAVKLFKSTNYSRLPLINEDGKVVGMVHVSDILDEPKSKILIDYVREMPKIPSNISLHQALETLRIKKSHMAIVTKSKINDDALGILTMEDIIEELIGEIYDEHDDEEEILEASLGKYYLWGSSLMTELVDASDVEFDFLENESLTEFYKRIRYDEDEVPEELEVGDSFLFEEKYLFEILEKNEENDYYFEFTIK
ncbi:CBS domain containing-hemolysin-like protein [Mycoplasma testudineum]|uniref:CBS domain containing-hemolysin-like protein n=1 Tax=Mycoplasma testudineum TaxID=244584 RepID=A0A4R6IHT0_9MOLU|nr:hemolysin family protein [Mycoplasma testudineum]OYD27112.1 hemolysin C [Mycoplasma testudineum]TDO21135.1 CBS domain containing-hemolysin-like protein [Mycoplasma testudineum]